MPGPPRRTRCPGCEGLLDHCPRCKTFSLCSLCPPETRHLEFCGRIEQQRAQIEALQYEEEQQPIQTRDEVCSKLAQETYTLFNLMLEANYPKPLSVHTIFAIVELWADPAIRDYWDNIDARRVTPALHISLNEDMHAFHHVLDLNNSGTPISQRGRYSHPPPFDGRRLARDTISILENIVALIPADGWFYFVPLVLIKLRLRFEIESIMYNEDRLAEVRRRIDARYLVSRGPRRGARDVRAIIHGLPLAQHIANLNNEIRALAQFGDSMGVSWESFWKYMCFPPSCPWRQEHPLDAAPEQIRMVIYANHHAWMATPGAFVEMGSLGLLGHDWARQLMS